MNTKSVIIFILGAIIGLIFGKESDLSQEKLILCNFDNELVDWSVPSNKPSTIVFITNDSFETKNDNEMENYKLLVKQNCAKIWHLLENEEILRKMKKILMKMKKILRKMKKILMKKKKILIKKKKILRKKKKQK